MFEDEYTNMYCLEDTYWYYRALHQLLEHYIDAFSDQLGHPMNSFDAGCGTGKLLTILEKYGKTKGIDFSEKAIEYCKMRGLENVETHDLYTYDNYSTLHDLITCIGVLYCFTPEQEEKILLDFYNALKPGGLFIFDSPAFNCLMRGHDIVVGGKRRHRRNEILPVLERLGFEVILESYRLSFLFVPVWIKKYVERIQKNADTTSDLKQLPFIVNWSLIQMHRLENWFIKKGVRFPFGTSLFIIAKKK